MARAIVAVQSPTKAGMEIAFTAGNAEGSAEGFEFTNDGKVILLVKESLADGNTLTLTDVADKHGRRETDAALTIALVQDKEYAIGPLLQEIWNQDNGKVYFALTSQVATTELAVIRVDNPA